MPAQIPKRDRLTALNVRCPDIDNYAKLLLDALTPKHTGEWGVWEDDNQIVGLTVWKVYATANGPRWRLTVSRATDVPADAPLAS